MALVMEKAIISYGYDWQNLRHWWLALKYFTAQVAKAFMRNTYFAVVDSIMLALFIGPVISVLLDISPLIVLNNCSNTCWQAQS